MTGAKHVRTFLLLTAAAIAAPAQTFAAPASAVVLNPITLTGDKEDEEVTADDLAVKDGDNLDTALRGKPGVFTRNQMDNPGVIVNIRGLQSMGRVNSTIDGVPQTARNLEGHQGTFDPLVFIDPGLISSVQITKGHVAGARGMGTLGGAADFRTLQFGDVLREGQNSGGLLRFGTGTNGKKWSATLAGATRHQTATGGTFGILGAISGLKDDAYKDGNGNVAMRDGKFDLSNGQAPRTWLLKSEYSDGDFGKLSVSAMGYRNGFLAGASSSHEWDVDQKSAAIDYQRDGLSAKLWWVENEIQFPRSAPGQHGESDGRRGVDTGKGFDLSHRNELTFGATPVALTYGVAYSHNNYDGNEKAGPNPDGSLTKAGVFVGAEASLGNARLTGELRYDRWKAEGGSDYKTNPILAPNRARSGGKINASLRGDYAITEATGVFASLSTTMRPPTVPEMFFPGAFPSDDPTMMQINNNPNLRPETAVNAELGLTHDQGPFSLSATLFNNRIKDFISYTSDSSIPMDDFGMGMNMGGMEMLRWVNMPGTTTMRGLELATRYDNGTFYTGLSATFSKTAKPATAFKGFIADPGNMPGVLATLDVGGRWMDGTLTAGTRVRYTGKASVFMGSPQPTDLPANTLIDLYADWRVNDSLHLYANVENATDRFYQTANAAFTEAQNNLGGRGRTIKVGGALKF